MYDGGVFDVEATPCEERLEGSQDALRAPSSPSVDREDSAARPTHRAHTRLDGGVERSGSTRLGVEFDSPEMMIAAPRAGSCASFKAPTERNAAAAGEILNLSCAKAQNGGGV